LARRYAAYDVVQRDGTSVYTDTNAGDNANAYSICYTYRNADNYSHRNTYPYTTSNTKA